MFRENKLYPVVADRMAPNLEKQGCVITCDYLWVSNCQFRFLGPFVLCRYGGVLLFLMEVSNPRVRYPKKWLKPSCCHLLADFSPSPGRSPVMADWFTFFHPWPTSLDMFGGFHNIYILILYVCVLVVNDVRFISPTNMKYLLWTIALGVTNAPPKGYPLGAPLWISQPFSGPVAFPLNNSSSNQRSGPNSCSLATPHMALLVSVCYCDIERSGVSAGVRLSECVPNFLHSSSKHFQTTGES